MDISAQDRGRATVVALRGRLDFDAADEVGDQLEAVLERPEGVQGLVLDASDLSYVSSAGLRVFLTVAKDAQEAGIPMAIAGLQSSVARVFEISGLSNAKVFQIRESVDDAVEAVTA